MAKPLSKYGAGNWEIIIPQATTNLFKNPSFETNLTGWSACGSASLTRDSTSQKFGVYSMKIVTAAAASDGANASFTMSTCATKYTFSAWVFGQSGLTYEMDILTDGSTVANASFAGSGVWGRHEITGTSGSKNSESACAAIKVFESTVTTFFVDAMQVESASAATTYCDGDQDGCLWLGSEHQSTSERSAQSRAGGAIVDLRNDYGILVRQQPGTGMPPMINTQTNIGLDDGGLFQRTLADVRTFTLEGVIEGSSIHALHQFRQQLIDAVKPDIVGTQQPLLLRYTGVNSTVNQIKAHYDSGLELTEAEADIEFVSVRFISYDPFWEEVGDEGISLTVSQTLSSVSRIIQRDSSGQWSDIGPIGGSGTACVLDVKYGPDDNLYVAGLFSDVAGSGISSIAKYNNETGAWAGLFENDNAACGLVGTAAIDMAFAPNGDLYAIGKFTTAGSVSAREIAKWDGSSWSSIGNGLSDQGQSVRISSCGQVYAAGQFIDAGSGAACTTVNRITYFDTDIWQAMDGGVTGLGAACNVLDVSLSLDNQTVYAVGTFDAAGSATASGIAQFSWNTLAWTPVGASSAFSSAPLSTEVSNTGIVYVGGSFTDVDGDTSILRIAQWNGSSWVGLGDGIKDGLVFKMFYDEGNNLLYVIGSFTSVGNLDFASYKLAIWNGTIWIPISVTTSATGDVGGIAVSKNGRVGYGFSDAGDVIVPPKTVVTNNGTATGKPTVKMLGGTSASTRITELRNYSTKDDVYFNLTLQPGEIVTLDMSGEASISMTSSFSQNLISKVLETSNLATFRLLPGANNITTFSTDTTASVTMQWKKRHWSIDAGSSI